MRNSGLQWCLPEDNLDEMMVWVAEFEQQNPGKKLWPAQMAKDKWQKLNMPQRNTGAIKAKSARKNGKTL